MLHPDKCKLPRGEEAMKNLSIAYGTLNNDAKRKNYDDVSGATATKKMGSSPRSRATLRMRQSMPQFCLHHVQIERPAQECVFLLICSTWTLGRKTAETVKLLPNGIIDGR
uniref:J domain-containing protein n=1 Tax=Rhodosorus marinus TaxID=101924 RepID=A0A7S2ZWF3_9RHOD|mmetsp:Transcript_35437/g.140884  ORF Transcript_35437/g.140884 Transcript_35437/m.140884 type:complete len:111 (+) Transcript_35437:1027-1359(+)